MDPKTIAAWTAQVNAERERREPPPHFPRLPDIPAARYTDPAFFELEIDRLWRRSWLYAAHTDQLREPGDFIIWNFGSAPIIVMRGDDDEIRAFYNTCRHRGAPVLREPAGRAPATLVCGYHGWSYDRAGRLLAVSEPRDWNTDHRPCKHLVEIACEQFNNWLFVNEDPNAGAFNDYIEPIARFWRHLPLDTLRLIHRETKTVRANVKVVIENFLEAYHFNLLHAATTHRIFDNRGTSIHLWESGHSMMLSPNRRPDWVDPGTVGMPEMAGATTIERDYNPSYSVFPNLILPIAPSGIPGVAIWPNSIDETTLEILWFAPERVDGPRDPLWDERIANFDRIAEEDVEFSEPIQQTLNSRGFTGVPLSYQERRIYHWHVSADRAMEVDQVPEALRVPPLIDDFVE